MILGVDLGNYSVKTSEKISFLSKVSEIESFSEEGKIEYNGKKIYIGEGEFSTDWNKSMKDNTLPLLFSAIYKSTQDSINQVVVGLPIQQYKAYKEELKILIQSNRCATVNGRKIVIDDIEVAPEGASAYYNIPNELGNRQLIIVDIGGRTTDVSLFRDKMIKDIDTIGIGMLNVYQDIIDTINIKYTQNFKLEDGEDILNHGLFLNGEEKNLSFIKIILQQHFNSIYKELQLKFNLNLGYVFLTGGGSMIFKMAFKNRLKNIIVSESSLWDNAIGFKRVGEQLWQER